jgi:hypothetical protein
MRRSLDQSDVLKELAVLADKLASADTTGEERLTLLRRQAQLGDLRDAIAERARRGTA